MNDRRNFIKKAVFLAGGPGVGAISTSYNSALGLFQDEERSLKIISSSTAVDIGNRLELLIDHTLIERMHKAKLHMHKPVRREVVMLYDKPWEGSGCSFRTVFKDEDIYRMYYTSWDIAADGSRPHPVFIAYAESKDGISWDRPNLSLVEFKGSRHNNIIMSQINGGFMQDFSPFKDGNPQASADAKYKAVGLGGGPRGIYTFKSKDAIHWTPIVREPVILSTGEKTRFDSQNIAFWDTQAGKYRIYLRGMRNGMRDILVSESADFEHWSSPEWLTYYNTPPDEQLYTNAVKPYYRAPHIYIGFPARYVDRGWTESALQLPELSLRKQRAAGHPRYGTAVTDALLMVSRDGKRFYRWPEAFISPGLKTKDNWSYGDNFVAWQLVETTSRFDDAPNELSLYATESYFTNDSCRLRRYTMRIDGFVSAYADIFGGEVITKPLTFSGKELVINYSTSAGGFIKIEILDKDGKAISGFSENDCDIIYGDQLERIVTWKRNGDLAVLTGQPVRLRFILADAHLYSFRFRKHTKD